MRLNGVQNTRLPSTRMGVVCVELLVMSSAPRRWTSPVEYLQAMPS